MRITTWIVALGSAERQARLDARQGLQHGRPGGGDGTVLRLGRPGSAGSARGHPDRGAGLADADRAVDRRRGGGPAGVGRPGSRRPRRPRPGVGDASGRGVGALAGDRPGGSSSGRGVARADPPPGARAGGTGHRDPPGDRPQRGENRADPAFAARSGRPAVGGDLALGRRRGHGRRRHRRRGRGRTDRRQRPPRPVVGPAVAREPRRGSDAAADPGRGDRPGRDASSDRHRRPAFGPQAVRHRRRSGRAERSVRRPGRVTGRFGPLRRRAGGGRDAAAGCCRPASADPAGRRRGRSGEPDPARGGIADRGARGDAHRGDHDRARPGGGEPGVSDRREALRGGPVRAAGTASAAGGGTAGGVGPGPSGDGGRDRFPGRFRRTLPGPATSPTNSSTRSPAGRPRTSSPVIRGRSGPGRWPRRCGGWGTSRPRRRPATTSSGSLPGGRTRC